MKWILAIILNLLFIATGATQVHLKSIYFQSQSTEIVPDSRIELDELKNLYEKKGMQVIEINAYAENENNAFAARKISDKRVDSICTILSLSKDEVSINYYGLQRHELNFQPLNWNRLDLYYFEFKNGDTTNVGDVNDTIREISDSSLIIKYPDSTKQINVQDTSTVINGIKTKNGMLIQFDIPIVIPIRFVGGTDEIVTDSYKYLDDLYQVMLERPDIHAHIRGHVCCGKNKRISRNRAKVVYKYLIGKGISKSRLSYKGYSNSMPLVFPEKTEKDKNRNRRVDVVFKSIPAAD